MIAPELITAAEVIGGIFSYISVGALASLLVDVICPDEFWTDDERVMAILFWPLGFVPCIVVAANQRLQQKRANDKLEADRLAKRLEQEDRISLLELQRAERELETFLKTGE